VPRRTVADRLDDIREACQAIARFADEADPAAFTTDELLVAAVLYQLTIIGEAAGHLPDALKAGHAHIPWAEVVGMRNVLVHEYFRVDADILWQTVQTDVPQLLAATHTMAEQLFADP